MNYKATILLAAALMLAGVASAEVALTVPEQQETTEDLSTTYTIGFINTGSEETVFLTSDAPETLNVSMPANITLAEAKPTSTPEGDDWYRLSPGKYVKIHYYDVDVSISDEASVRDFNFTISATTSYKSSRNRPEVENVRQVLFQLRSESPEIDTSFNEDLFTEDGLGRRENVSQNNTSGQKSIDNASSSENQNETIRNGQQKDEGSDFNRVTILLAVGITVSAVYVVLEGFL